MYTYTWGNNEVRARYKGRRCEVVAKLARNSVVLRFENGEQLVTSRYAIRRARMGSGYFKPVEDCREAAFAAGTFAVPGVGGSPPGGLLEEL